MLSTNTKKETEIQINKSSQLTNNNKSEVAGNISSGNIQNKQDAHHISQTLNNLANQAGDYDYGTKIQLRSLSDAVSIGSGADIWSAASIYKTIDPDVVVERFRSHQRFAPAINRIAEIFVDSLSFRVKCEEAQELLSGQSISDAMILQPKSPGRTETPFGMTLYSNVFV